MNDEQNKNSKEIQKSLKEIKDIISNTNLSDIKDITITVNKVKGYYKKFSKSDKVAPVYGSTLVDLARNQESLAEVEATVAEAKCIYEKFPDLEDVASQYVFILNTLVEKLESLADLKATVAEAKCIYEKFPKSYKVASQYAFILNTLAERLESLTDVKATVTEASSIYGKFQDSEDVAFQYVRILYTLASRLESLADLKATVAEVSRIYGKFQDSEDVAFLYVSTLDTLASRLESLADLKATVAEVSRIYGKFQDSEDVAFLYVSTLYTLATSQKSLGDLKVTVTEARCIYEKFPESYKVAFLYVSTLTTLASSQETPDDVEGIEEEAKRIYEKFPDSEDVAYAYAKALVYLESKQNLQETFTKVIDIYNSFSKKDYISSLFADLISEDIIGNIFYYNDNLDSLNSDIVPVIKEIFNNIIELDELELPGYAPLIGLLRDLEDCYREQLIKIYWIVQKIKYELSIKDLSENKFGHYTSGNVLQILLKQSSDNKGKYSIEGRTRLGNVKYMNDPEEGSVLDRYLKLGRSNNLEVSLKPSPWFLMSLTTEIDNLAMWSQYGVSAEGVCLVFKTDSFKVYKSMAETEWIRKFDNPILEKNLASTKGEETNSSDKKDYLYRVCYLDEESLNKGLSDVVTESNNNLLSEKERTIINDCLGKLKDISNGIKGKPSLYSAFEECLEEVRYLFKVSGYRYESELRILKYAMLDPNNTDIKIDDKSGKVAKLYLERDMPIQLEQVIFGPKFSNPEHVVPLLHLLDKEIELKRSERKFK